MPEQDYILTLSKDEQQALAICGITQAKQMAACCYDSLCRDLAQAKAYFPEQVACLTDERLKAIYQACGNGNEQSQPASLPNTDEQQDVEPRQSCPTQTVSRNQQRHALSQEQTEHKHFHSKYNSIHCYNPLRVYLTAWITLLLYLDFVAWIIIPPLLFIEIIDISILIMLGVLILPLVLYVSVYRKTMCAVCNMPLFTLRAYTRNRYAHKLPLLGTTLPTALHTIFFFWFRCPACGTPQKLLGRKKHR